MTINGDPTRRFSNRVSDYVKYRPSYPSGLLDFMERELGLTAQSVVADVGSGTGLFTRQLLERGAKVFGVEPNDEMRGAAEQLLHGYEKFKSIARPAEETGLATSSIDIVCAATAFHWFDGKRAKTEWKRILRPTGTVLLIWNVRKNTSPFLIDYEDLLNRFSEDYGSVQHRSTEESGAKEALFSPQTYQIVSFPNEQSFDFEGLKGRLLSTSYAPTEGHPGYLSMMAKLRDIFDKHQVDGKVLFEYDAKAYYGKI